MPVVFKRSGVASAKVKFFPSEAYETRRRGMPAVRMSASGMAVAADHVMRSLLRAFLVPWWRRNGGMLGWK